VRPGRLTPAPGSFGDSEIPFRERVKAALAKLRENPDRDLSALDQFQLSPDELEFVLKTAHLPADVDLNRYTEAWLRFRQQFAMPRLRGYTEDLAVMLGQPEMLACLLGLWPYPPESSTGPKPLYSGSKAVMLLMGGLGMGPHVDNAFEQVNGNPGHRRVFEWAFAHAAELAGKEPVPFQLAGRVESVLRHFPKLATTLGRGAVEANVQMLRSLAALHPNKPICEIGGIDGTAVVAWADQRRGRDADDEARLRRRASHAGFRAYERRNGKKEDVPAGQVTRKWGKLWRGYHLVVLVDYCTGRPIVWTLVDASLDEARALEVLLPLLYELWPDCPLKTIVGDTAWDELWAHQLCEANYGVHLVASRTTRQDAVNAKHSLPEREGKLIDHFDGLGRAFCVHRKQLTYLGNSLPKRDGLAPGELAPEAQFRLRFRCEDGCGTPSLQMRLHWTALAYYPHTPDGQRKRYAERYALLAHRNVCESLFNALKVGHGIATVGADRLRLTHFDSVKALIDLSFCMGTALMLGQERNKLGVGYATPPDEALAA
jgi:hypothetical protein